jgi:hypothetical protein
VGPGEQSIARDLLVYEARCKVTHSSLGYNHQPITINYFISRVFAIRVMMSGGRAPWGLTKH